MKSYDAILFDFDGTILKTDQAIVHCLEKVLSRSAVILEPGSLMKHISRGAGL